MIKGLVGNDAEVHHDAATVKTRMMANTKVSMMLCQMGFRKEDVESAIMGADVEGTSQEVNLGSGLNWLLLNVDEAHLPRTLGAVKKAPAVVAGRGKKIKQVKANQKGTLNTKDMSPTKKKAHQLAGYGFEVDDALDALTAASKQSLIPSSLTKLYEWYGIKWAGLASLGADVPNGVRESRLEAEHAALEDIFGDDFKLIDTASKDPGLRVGFHVLGSAFMAGASGMGDVNDWAEHEVVRFFRSVAVEFELR
jgi:hypothetical protein